MRGAIVASGLLAGCDLFFPLRDPTFMPPETQTVTGTMTIRNAQLVGGVPEVVDSPGEAVQLGVQFADGKRTNVAVQPDGSFEFARPTNEYVFEYTFDGQVRELHETAAELEIVLAFAGRPDAEPVTAALVQFPIASQATGYAATIGQWTNTALDFTTRELDWPDATLLGGRDVGLFSGNRGDRMFYLHYGDQGGQVAIRAFKEVPSFEMVEGATSNQALLLVDPVTENGCVRIDAQLEAQAARFDAVIAGSDPPYSPSSRAWNVVAVPSSVTGTLGGISLVAGGETNLDLVATDALYHDPFPNHELLVGVGVSAVRSAAGIPVGSGTSIIVPAPHGTCPEVPVDITGAVPFPLAIQIDGTPLDTDDQLVNLDGPVVVSWTFESFAFDFFEVQLKEIDFGNREAVIVRRFRTRDPRIEIGKGVLEKDKSYVLAIATIVGFPKAREGDYDTIAYPFGSAVISTPSFKGL